MGTAQLFSRILLESPDLPTLLHGTRRFGRDWRRLGEDLADGWLGEMRTIGTCFVH